MFLRRFDVNEKRLKGVGLNITKIRWGDNVGNRRWEYVVSV